jgi:hypothetical protein
MAIFLLEGTSEFAAGGVHTNIVTGDTRWIPLLYSISTVSFYSLSIAQEGPTNDLKIFHQRNEKTNRLTNIAVWHFRCCRLWR